MKINELISSFVIYTTIEEGKLLDKIKGTVTPNQFTEREVRVIEALIKKSLISKKIEDGKVYLVKNGKPY